MSVPAGHGVSRALVLVAYVAYLAAVGFLVFEPTARHAGDSVAFVGHTLHAWHAPAWLSGTVPVEFGCNVVLFVPLSLLGSLLLLRWGWRDWLAVGFVASGVIELTQLVFLPGRSATFSDVVANTAGSLLGAVVSAGLRYRR